MSDIAKLKKGQYYNITNIAHISPSFGSCLGGLKSVIAKKGLFLFKLQILPFLKVAR